MLTDNKMGLLTTNLNKLEIRNRFLHAHDACSLQSILTKHLPYFEDLSPPGDLQNSLLAGEPPWGEANNE